MLWTMLNGSMVYWLLGQPSLTESSTCQAAHRLSGSWNGLWMSLHTVQYTSTVRSRSSSLRNACRLSGSMGVTRLPPWPSTDRVRLLTSASAVWDGAGRWPLTRRRTRSGSARNVGCCVLDLLWPWSLCVFSPCVLIWRGCSVAFGLGASRCCPYPVYLSPVFSFSIVGVPEIFVQVEALLEYTGGASRGGHGRDLFVEG
ncbi:hypothetical protein B0T24DRAFT_632442 [Lasiosphaeria ovina]|uniref:Secreted protein n=1 Tax=Lasiosphaeria ovina TaxID=92902 RepID=A0AAE0N408_9PEZI|nr:hypothetical protein B0T24DRAFT_632442 [Lasiosphaeria ovina]